MTPPGTVTCLICGREGLIAGGTHICRGTPPHAPTLADLLQDALNEGLPIPTGPEAATELAAWLEARGVRVASPAAPPEPTEAMVDAARTAFCTSPFGSLDERTYERAIRAALRAASPVESGRAASGPRAPGEP